jgi:hypothetical protein
VKGASNYSLDSTRTDKTGKTEKSSEADADISDQDTEPFGEQMAIPISDLSSPITAYTPPAVLTPRTSVGDIPISDTSAPVVYMPEPSEGADILLQEVDMSPGPVFIQDSRETDV